MTWAALLLADPSPCLRRLVLRDLLGRAGDDAEVAELAAATEDDPLVNELVAAQRPDGSWAGAGPDSTLDPTRATSLALARLGYLGLGPEHPLVQRGAEYVFGQQRPDGSWPLPERDDDSQEGAGYTMMPLQTALPLRGLAACGLATDPRAERAYAWLLARRLPEGAWPPALPPTITATWPATAAWPIPVGAAAPTPPLRWSAGAAPGAMPFAGGGDGAGPALGPRDARTAGAGPRPGRLLGLARRAGSSPFTPASTWPRCWTCAPAWAPAPTTPAWLRWWPPFAAGRALWAVDGRGPTPGGALGEL
jgi:hypothetical protein